MAIKTKEIHDGDYCKILLCENTIETHATKSRQTYLAIRIQYINELCGEMHNDILTAAGHKPEPRDYSNKYEENHCIKCFELLDENDKAEYMEPNNWDELEPCCCQAESFHVELLAVNPGIQTKKTIADIESDFGGELVWKDLPVECKIEMLIDRGTSACLFQQSGIDENELTKLALIECQTSQTLAGFQLDSPQNAIGSTGWDFMKGDILGGLKR